MFHIGQKVVCVEWVPKYQSTPFLRKRVSFSSRSSHIPSGLRLRLKMRTPQLLMQ